MSYNLTSIDNTTGLDQYLININAATNGYIGISILILVWIAGFIYASNRNLPPAESYTTTSFIVLLIAGLMYFAGMIGLMIVILNIVLFFAGVLYLMFM